MKYRKKPVVIEAFQLGIDNMPDWFENNVTDRKITLYHSPEDIYADIKTLEGIMRAKHGDFIIQGVNGEIYPCKPDIFMKTYERVEE